MTPCHGHTMGRAPQGAAAFPGNLPQLQLCSKTGNTAAQPGSPNPGEEGRERGVSFLGCFVPTLTPLRPAGVPAGSPTCAAAATKGDEYVMLRCRWEGGTPRVTLSWRDSGGRALGDPSASTAVLVLSTDGSLGGREFVCVAAHPLRVSAAECRLRLGKRVPRAPREPRRGCRALAGPSPLVAEQRSPSWRRRARWRCWRAVRRSWRAGNAAAAPGSVPRWLGTTPSSGR